MNWLQLAQDEMKKNNSDPHANSANSAERSENTPIGTNGTIGKPVSDKKTHPAKLLALTALLATAGERKKVDPLPLIGEHSGVGVLVSILEADPEISLDDCRRSAADRGITGLAFCEALAGLPAPWAEPPRNISGTL